MLEPTQGPTEGWVHSTIRSNLVIDTFRNFVLDKFCIYMANHSFICFCSLPVISSHPEVLRPEKVVPFAGHER